MPQPGISHDLSDSVSLLAFRAALALAFGDNQETVGVGVIRNCAKVSCHLYELSHLEFIVFMLSLSSLELHLLVQLL